MSRYDTAIMIACTAYGLPEPELEFKFHPNRKFRVDMFFKSEGSEGSKGGGLAVEIEGGIFNPQKRCPFCHRQFSRGHGSITGIKRDIEKYNLLTLMGYRLLRFFPDEIEMRGREIGSAWGVIREALKVK